MDGEFTISSALSERYSTDVLRYLYSRKCEIKYSDLKFIVNNFPTLEKLLLVLENSNLVITRKTLKPYKTNYVQLTSLGISVAEQLQKAETIMSGEMIIDSDPDTDYDLSSEKRDITCSESINHSVSNSIQSPTPIKVLVAVQNSPGITTEELTKVFGEKDLCNIINDAENEKYIFKCDMGRSDGKSGYYLTAKGVNLIGSRAFSKNMDVVEMDCNASSSEENMARR